MRLRSARPRQTLRHGPTTPGALRLAGLLLAAAAAAALLGACAAPEQGKEIAVREEPEYVTGSNLPKRDRSRSGVKTVDPATVQQAPPTAPPSTLGGR